jgi:hypothetical protein
VFMRILQELLRVFMRILQDLLHVFMTVNDGLGVC